MNQLFQKLRGFFADRVHRSAVLLCGCTLLAVSAGVGSAFLFSKPAVPAVDMQEPAPSVSLTVSSSATSFPSSASVTETSSATSLADSIAEEKEPIQLTLVAESYTQDLNVNIVDETGAEIVQEIHNYLTYGNFISAVINFLIMAVVVFFIVKFVNQLNAAATRKEREEAEAAAAAKAAAEAEAAAKAAEEAANAPHVPTTEELLTQIRDLLKNK